MGERQCTETAAITASDVVLRLIVRVGSLGAPTLLEVATLPRSVVLPSVVVVFVGVLASVAAGVAVGVGLASTRAVVVALMPGVLIPSTLVVVVATSALTISALT